MSDVSCECGQTATCKRFSVSILLKRMATICVYTVSMATRTVTIGASPLSGSLVALDDGCAWLVCDRDTCLFSLPRARTQTLHQGLIWQMGESMMSPLVTGWLIGCRNFDRNWWFHFFSSHQLIHSPSPRQQVGDLELLPLAPHPHMPATSEQQLDIAQRRDHHDV